MECLTLSMCNAHQGYQVLINKLWPWLKSALMAGHEIEITASLGKRSSMQNARLHAMLASLSVQLEWHGKKLDAITWKRLCMAAWLREEGQSVELIPALDGNGFDVIYERTSQLSKAQCSRLTEWIDAFAAERGVMLNVDQKTGEIFQ